MNKRLLEFKIRHFFRNIPPDLLLDIYAGRISRELWWMNQEFSPVE
jgi:hypothetical protein